MAMQIFRRFFFYLLFILSALVIGGTGTGLLILRNSMPRLDGNAVLNHLSAPVTISSGQHGIPVITANNRADALRALGYVSARDRLFQMDLMRRKNAGRLAELFGQAAVKSDIRARTCGFYKVAKAVMEKLPPEHKRYLEAYAEGVNGYIDAAPALAFEFTVLDYQPEPWKPEDTVLVIVGMFDTLTAAAEQEERMLSVMEKSLPKEIVAFLTPDTDRFTDRLLGSAESRRPAQPIPAAALETVLATHPSSVEKPVETVQLRDFATGSNAWAVSGTKTPDGRAILANDMHLGISVPNIWYRSEINYGAAHTAGVILPGTPLMVAGSNNHIAWGSTNLSGDFLDLVSLELNPEKPDEYKVAGNWQRFEQTTETISVKDAKTQQIEVRGTVWGPVAAELLLDKPVAVHWTALDGVVVTMELLELEQTETLQQAIRMVNHTAGPPLNFLLADKNGQIAWTFMGRIPRRFGNDGSVSRSWADGTIGWNGYVEAQNLPRVVNPVSGMLVSANDRRLGRQFPYVIGRQFANGYRAYRITQRLGEMKDLNENSLFELQLDTKNEFHAFYQQLALTVLSPAIIEQQPELRELRGYLLAWNGRADTDSKGFALLVEFRKHLAEAVFSPFLTACRKLDKNFSYSWTYIDTPLQAMLTAKPPRLLPDPIHYKNWNAFILGQLRQSARQLQAKYPNMKLSDLTWGKVNKAHFAHPFSRAVPLLGLLLDMPEDQLAGCSSCIRVAGPKFGATERLVVSPAHLDQGILHMPGGQSAHPLSPYYRDQHYYWVHGLPIDLLAGKSAHSLTLKPGSN
ncbi:Penicillin amidase [Candidatus Methylobacter favarea]|uniref:Penicillin amidase n=1 Tax=Candidatus Methylobacter favarea TaxID=2707345 RepID=A0A8S0WKX1_9GAMM|nr:penicillin acylase family protein [Candidatus Methylobacter favarea]CAA9892260.1 Penicillin amidase [Candidatus Methylobacter favarea]